MLPSTFHINTIYIYDTLAYASISCVVYEVPDQHHLYMTYHHMRVYLVLHPKFHINNTYIRHTSIWEYILCCLRSSISTPLIYGKPAYGSVSCVASDVPYQHHLYMAHQHMGVYLVSPYVTQTIPKPCTQFVRCCGYCRRYPYSSHLPKA